MEPVLLCKRLYCVSAGRWRSILDSGEREFASTRIGDEVRAELRALDPVAWLRFTSVYLNFHTIEEFRAALDELEVLKGDWN